MKIIRKVALLVLLSIMMGCSSIRTFDGEDSHEFNSIVYSGVRLNIAYWACLHQMDYLKDAPFWQVSLNTVAYSFYYTPDLLLSMVVDTVTVPYDIYSKVGTDEENFPDIECHGLAPYFG